MSECVRSLREIEEMIESLKDEVGELKFDDDFDDDSVELIEKWIGELEQASIDEEMIYDEEECEVYRWMTGAASELDSYE